MGCNNNKINLPGLYDDDSPVGEHILTVWLVPQILAVTTLDLQLSPETKEEIM